MHTRIERWTCDACGETISTEKPPREIPRPIAGVPDFKPEGHGFMLAVGYNQSIPFDLCEGCERRALEAFDPKGTVRKSMNDAIVEWQKKKGRNL